MKKNKNKNLREVAYLRKINEERKKINEELNEELTKIIKNNESLNNYELWVNKKGSIFIQPQYIIKKVEKDLEKEGFSADSIYVIIKKI